MNKPTGFRWLKGVLVALSLLLISQAGWASHLVGGDLTVSKLGNNRYEITLNYFYDCGGNPGAFAADTPPKVEYESANCGLSGSIKLSSVNGTGKDIAPICSKRSSRCQAGNTKGIENWVFKDTVTLSKKCTDWEFYWHEDARSEAITTLQNPGTESLYLEAEINNDSFPNNNIPEFTNQPVAFICKGQDFVFNNGVVDPDGDSLVYSLYKPKSYVPILNNVTTVTYKSGYSYKQPLKSSPPVSIDSSTGDIKISPTKIDTTVLGVRVKEYDSSGTLKSKILRDVQIIVTSCSSPSAPDFTGVSDSADYYDSTNVNFDTTVCPGQQVTFYVNASEPNGNDTLYMGWNSAIKGASFQVFGDSTKSPYGKFTWTPPNPKAGKGIERNTFTVSVRDNNCPYYTKISRGFVVNVIPSKTVELGDTGYVACDDSLKLKPVVKGASADSNLTYDWSTGQKGDSIYIQKPGSYAVTVRDSGNCPITDSIRVFPSLDPSYQITSSFAADRGCVNDSVQFTDSSKSEKAIVNKWDWDFGDGDTSDLQNPKHKFSDTGNYDVRLIIADTNGCQDTLNQTIAIDSKPKASFTFKKACSREATSFKDQSSVGKGRIFNYQWDFGDGDSSSKPSPKHVFDTGGQYKADLVVTTSGNCKDTALKKIRINPKPIANFKSDNTCKGLGTQYTEQASIEQEDSITSYNWQLKPGFTSNKPNPITTYNSTGTFNVSLAVTSSNNCDDSIVKSVNINIKPNLNTLSDTTFCKGDSVKLATSISPDDNTTLFEDDFEGGINSSNWLSTSLGNAGSYCGTQQGSNALYFDGDGSSRKAVTKDLDTRKADTLTFYFKYGTGNNNFPFSVNGCDAIEGSNNETVSVGYSTDGGSSWNTLQTLGESNYSQSGFKKVSLFIPGSAKTASTRFRWKQASYDNCNSGFFGTRCFDNWAFDDVEITNRVDYQFAWHPGTGLNDTSVLSPKVKTTTVNTYTITATDTAFNCSVKDSVKLTPQTITADFKSSGPVCEYAKANYTDQSTIQSGKLSSSTWRFGDGDQSSVTNPKHRFPSNGNYNVQLVRESKIGCKDSLTQADSIFKQPTADFTFDTACLGEATNFTDQAFVSTDTVSQYTWKFASSGSSSKANPSFTFGTADSFEVTQVVGSSKGCEDTASKFVDVGGVPKADFKLSPVCEKAIKSFIDLSSVSYDSLIKWKWEFGDGSTAKTANPNHRYDSNGNYQVELTVTSNFQCTDSVIKTQPVNPNPVSSFDVLDSAQCLRSNRFKLLNNTTIDSGKMTFSWDFGDTNTSTKPAPKHTYGDTGTYEISLRVRSKAGCTDTSRGKVTVHPMPQAAFSVNDGAQCLSGNLFQFTGKSNISKGGLTEKWFFGDGASASKNSPTHSYQSFGTYQVRLVATSNKGCRDTAKDPIRVNPKPEPSFAYSQDSAQCLKGNRYLFTSTSSIDTGNLNFNWLFGDGSRQIGDSVVNRYAGMGTYRVKLLARSDSGCRDSTFRKVTVHPMPNASIGVKDSAQCQDVNLFKLQNKSSILKGNLTYKWEFGNSTKASSISPDVVYDTARNFNIQMVARSDKGCFDTAYQGVTVHPEPTAAFKVKDPAQCVRSNKFNLIDQTKLRNGVLSFDWDFGDGTSSTRANPNHRYQQVDTFMVRQIVETGKGCLDTAENNLYTDPMPSSRIAVNGSKQCRDPNLFNFTNNSTIAIGNLSYSWFFDDGSSSNKKAPKHRYSKAGSYEPRMVAVSDSGCRDTASIQLTVAPQTKVAFSVNDSLQCKRGNLFEFTNESNQPTANMQYFWFFGDGSNGRSETASHQYDTTGDFKVRLATRTADGCKDTLQKTMMVKPHPKARFSADRGCAGQKLTFRDESSIIKDSITGWNYRFDDGSRSSIPNPIHIFSSGGTYGVKLEVTSPFGCSDTFSQNVIIYGKPSTTPVIKASTTPEGHNILTWKPANSAIPNFYRLQRSRGDDPFKKLAVVDHPVRRFADTAVNVDSHKYSYQIQLVDSCGNEGPFNQPAHRPIQLDAKEGEGDPILNWSGYRGWPVRYYQVQLSKPNGEGFRTISSFDALFPGRRQLIDSLSTLQLGKLCYRIAGVKSDPDTTIRTFSNVSCIDPTVRMFVPNAFSPNGDGYNDSFYVKGTYLTNVRIQVYNRWGEEVFEGDGKQDAWHGLYNGEKLPTGSYTYVITAKGADGRFIQRDGQVMLIR